MHLIWLEIDSYKHAILGSKGDLRWWRNYTSLIYSSLALQIFNFWALLLCFANSIPPLCEERIVTMSYIHILISYPNPWIVFNEFYYKKYKNINFMENPADVLTSIGVYFYNLRVQRGRRQVTSSSFGERQEIWNDSFLTRDICRNQELSVPRWKWPAEIGASTVVRKDKATRRNSLYD